MKKNSIKKQYQESWKLLLRAKWYTVISIAIFSLAFIIGFIFPIFFKTQIQFMLKTMAEMFLGLNMFQTISKIFFNNLRAGFISLLFGLVFGIMPLFSSLFNGYLGGFVGRMAVDVEGLGILLRLIPHGIFELTAIFISLGLAIYLANLFLQEICKIKKQKFRMFIIITIFLITTPLNLYLNVVLATSNVINPNNLVLAPPVIMLGAYNLIILSTFLYFLYLSSKNKKMKTEIAASVKAFILIVIPLLFIAAIVEGILIVLGV